MASLGRVKHIRSKVARAGKGRRKVTAGVEVWRADVPGFFAAKACLHRGPDVVLGPSARPARFSRRCSRVVRGTSPTGAIKKALKDLGRAIR